MTISAHKTIPQNHTKHTRFTPSPFTGKERDEETGYGYFGARYMDHELMTMWLSVDPMADKYPGVSPYNYCAWNPILFVDPDGEEKVISFAWPSLLYPKNNYSIRQARHYTRNKGVIHFWGHGSSFSIQTANYLIKQQEVYKFHQFLKENSKIYSKNNKDGEDSKTSLLVLHSCSTGKKDGIAQEISASLNLLVVAPTDDIKCTLLENGSNSSESVVNNGVWAIYYRGELMDSFNGNTKPLFDNPDEVIKKYQEQYQAKHDSNNDEQIE